MSGIATEYKVTKGLMGGHKVSFACHVCTHPLVASLDDAGTEGACPKCGTSFTVPGERELGVWREEQEARKAEAAQRDAERIASAPKPKPKPRKKMDGAWPPSRPPSNVPRLEAIQAAATAYYLIALIAAAFGGLLWAMSAKQGNGWIGFATFVGSLVTAFFLVVVGQFISAFRDLVISNREILQELRKQKQQS